MLKEPWKKRLEMLNESPAVSKLLKLFGFGAGYKPFKILGSCNSVFHQ